MACLFISIVTLALGIAYIVTGYHVPVGCVQVILGLLCIGLCILWMVTRHREKKNRMPSAVAAEEPVHKDN